MAGSVARLKAMVGRLWTPALLAYVLNAAVALASFAVTFVLARISGATVIGQYALAVSTANLMVVFSLQGMDRTLIREVAGDLRERQEARARAVVRHLRRHAAIISLAVSIIWLLLVEMTPLNDWIGGNRLAMLIVPLLVPITVFFRLGVAAIRATNAPLRGQLAEALPTLLFPLLLLPFWHFGLGLGAGLAVSLLTGLHLFAGLAALAILAPIVRRWPREPVILLPGLRTAGLAIMGTQFVQLFTDWFILVQLSSSASPAEAGAFRVALQIITIFLTIIATSEAYVMARVAGDFRIGRPDLAWRRHRRASLLMLALASPLLLLCLLWPRQMLELAFGPEFGIAATGLAIMAAVQIVHVGRGPLGSMLSMARRDDIQLKLGLGAAIVGVAASWFLIPRLGLTGAAIAQGLPLLIRGILGTLLARRLLPRDPVQPPGKS